MTGFVRRRALHFALFLGAAAAAVIWIQSTRARLGPANLYSGWALFAGMCVLALYNARKKVLFLPLLRSSTWLQLHVYVGLLTVVLFALHAGLAWPDGTFEVVLYLVFAAVAMTGVLGLILSRLAAKKLSRRGEEVLFERIPLLRRTLRERAEELVVGAATARPSQAVAAFHSRHLELYLRRKPGPLAHLLGDRRAERQLRLVFDNETRFMTEEDRAVMVELRSLACQKSDLEYHHFLQGMLKGWLFAHVPLTYVLVVLSAFHVILVNSFGESLHR